MPMEVPPSQVQSIAEQSAPAGQRSPAPSSSTAQRRPMPTGRHSATPESVTGSSITTPTRVPLSVSPAQYSFAANEAPFENPATTTSAHCVAATAWATTSTADASSSSGKYNRCRHPPMALPWGEGSGDGSVEPVGLPPSGAALAMETQRSATTPPADVTGTPSSASEQPPIDTLSKPSDAAARRTWGFTTRTVPQRPRALPGGSRSTPVRSVPHEGRAHGEVERCSRPDAPLAHVMRMTNARRVPPCRARPWPVQRCPSAATTSIWSSTACRPRGVRRARERADRSDRVTRPR